MSWVNSGFVAPKIPYVYYDGEYMAVIDDSTQFIRFMDKEGQIYMAYNAYCNVPAGNNNIYQCQKVDPILCAPVPGLDYAKDTFVLQNIIPTLL